MNVKSETDIPNHVSEDDFEEETTAIKTRSRGVGIR